MEDLEAKKWATIRDQDASDARTKRRRKASSARQEEESAPGSSNPPVAATDHISTTWHSPDSYTDKVGTDLCPALGTALSDDNNRSPSFVSISNEYYDEVSDLGFLNSTNNTSRPIYTDSFEESSCISSRSAVESAITAPSNSYILSAAHSPEQTVISESSSDPTQDLETQYLTHFNTHVLIVLARPFREIVRRIGEYAALRATVLAVSASHLAHLQASQRNISDGSVKRGSRLYYDHLENGIKYYNSAMRLLSQLSIDHEPSLEISLASTLLFSDFEHESGSPRGFFTHISGADALVLAKHTLISRSCLGRQLLSCWAGAHARKEIHKLPFRPLDLEKDSVATRSTLFSMRCLMNTYATHTDALMVYLCDAFRINRRILLESCMGHGVGDVKTAMRRSIKWYSQHFGFPYADEEELQNYEIYIPAADLIPLLAHQRSKLDLWHDNLKLDDLPVERFAVQMMERNQMYKAQSSSSSSTAESPANSLSNLNASTIYPLFFHNQRAAENYMFYAIGQLLSSQHPGGLMPEPDSEKSPELRSRGAEGGIADENWKAKEPEQEPDLSPINPWAMIIMRTLAGLDPKNCIHTYSLGLVWIFTELFTCCPDRRITTYVLFTIIPRFEAEMTHGQLMLELARYKKVLIVLHEEICREREPLLVHPNYHIDCEAVAVVDSNWETWVAVHGRIKGRKGEVFNDYLEIR